MNVKKVEQNYNVNVDKLKAFTISGEDGKINRNLNAELLLPKALERKKYNLMVLEMGVNEVSNIDLNLEQHVMEEIIKNHMEKLFLLAV